MSSQSHSDHSLAREAIIFLLGAASTQQPALREVAANVLTVFKPLIDSSTPLSSLPLPSAALFTPEITAKAISSALAFLIEAVVDDSPGLASAATAILEAAQSPLLISQPSTDPLTAPSTEADPGSSDSDILTLVDEMHSALELGQEQLINSKALNAVLQARIVELESLAVSQSEPVSRLPRDASVTPFLLSCHCMMLCIGILGC